MKNTIDKYSGRMIQLSAILSQHQRKEKLAKRKLQPTIRFIGTSNLDHEAEAICDALSERTNQNFGQPCSKLGNFAKKLEW